MTATDVLRYYRECAFDYALLWGTRRTSAMHYGYYDAHVRTHTAAIVNMISEVARAARTRPGSRVLDAGCGLGGTALWLAERGARVTGINISTRQLDIAHTHTGLRRGTARARLH